MKPRRIEITGPAANDRTADRIEDQQAERSAA
jgi:molecular chaperone IbpA